MKTAHIAAAMFLMTSVPAWGGLFLPANFTCDLKGEAGVGLVILSATLPESKHPFAPRDLFIDYGQVGLTHHSMVRVSRTRLLVPVQSDFNGVYGHLYALKLPAGDYTFGGWYYLANVGDRNIFPSRRLEALPFHVEAGRATYVGSFFTQFRDTGTPGLFNYPQGFGWVSLVDEHERDLSVFAQKCSTFGPELIDTRILDTMGWINKAEDQNPAAP